jgi:hypothetical protein
MSSYCDEYEHLWFGKHRLKAGIPTESEVHLLGNGSLVLATTNKIPKQELFSVVADIQSFRSYKRDFFVNSRDSFVREFRMKFSS